MSESACPLVVAVCGDAGGGNAVAPVIAALRAEGRVTVQALAYRQARTLWARQNLVFDEISEDTTLATATELLCRSGAALLLAGTSVNPIELEKKFIGAARDLGLPSLAVLDFWSNYARRFSDAEGRLAYMPDRIAIMDEQARDEIVAEGFEPARLVITGQPAFDDLVTWRLQFTPARRQAIRESLRVGPDELLVLFASESVSELYGLDSAHPLYPGYDEHVVFRALATALDQIAEQQRQKIVLIVRPHPREQEEPWKEASRGHAVRILVSKEGEPRDLVMAADLITGMNTVLLVEACYLGGVTVSLQPGLRLPDALPTNRLRLSCAVYRHEEIKPTLERMLLDREARLATQARLENLRLEAGATQRVVKLVYQMVGLV